MRSPPKSTEPQDLAQQRAEDAQYYRQILQEVIEVGIDMIRLTHQQAKAAALEAASVEAANAARPQTDGAVAFERLSRAVRRTILLADKLAEPIAAAADHRAQHRSAARRRIIREVEDGIQRDVGDSEAKILHADLLDRLDGAELDEEIDNRPVADIIVDVCRDFGLDLFPGTHPWKRRNFADVIALSARAAAPRAAPIPPVGPAMPPRTRSGSDPPRASG